MGAIGPSPNRSAHDKAGVERFLHGWGGGFVEPAQYQPDQGAHAPDEYYLIDSTNPKVAGLVDSTMGYVEFLYTLAAIK